MKNIKIKIRKLCFRRKKCRIRNKKSADKSRHRREMVRSFMEIELKENEEKGDKKVGQKKIMKNVEKEQNTKTA